MGVCTSPGIPPNCPRITGNSAIRDVPTAINAFAVVCVYLCVYLTEWRPTMAEMDRRKRGRLIRRRARVELEWIRGHIFPRGDARRERRAAVETARTWVDLGTEADHG